MFGSGVIAVLSYVKLVGRTEMNVSLLESFENRPCKGRGEHHEQPIPSSQEHGTLSGFIQHCLTNAG